MPRWSPAPHVLRSKNVCLPDGVRPASVVVHDGLIQRIAEWDDTAHPSSDVQDVGELERRG